MYRWQWWILLLCMLGLTACGSGSSGFDGGGDSAESNYTEESVLDFAGFPCEQGGEEVEEVEPNDDMMDAQVVGEVRSDECFTIRGTVATVSDHDVYRIALEGPQTLVAILTHSVMVNFDLELFSEEENRTVLTCNEVESPEACAVTFLGDRDDLLITVVPVEGDGEYTLEIISVVPIDVRDFK